MNFCQYMSKIFQRHVQYVFKVCPRMPRYKDMLKICSRYSKDMSKTFGFCLLKIWQKYSQNMPKISTIYAQQMPKISPRYAKDMAYISCTLRSGLHEIPTTIRTFPHGLEINHVCKWISDNSSGMLNNILFLENCLKSVCMYGCSPIHVKRSFFFIKV